MSMAGIIFLFYNHHISLEFGQECKSINQTHQREGNELMVREKISKPKWDYPLEGDSYEYAKTN